MIATPAVERAQAFMWTGARLLERHLFAFRFSGGGREPVLAALRAYQNADGGFGNALEPDKRCADSQPIDAEIALRVLAEVGPDDAMIGRACDWLTTITTAEGGVPFVLPTVRSAPRAGWWNTDDDPPASINPTASIAGLLTHLGVRHPWLDRALPFCWRVIEESETEEPHELLAMLLFIDHAPDRARAERAAARLGERLLGRGLVALDPHAAGYVKKPLEWAPTPASSCRLLFANDVIAAHLDALAAEQAEDGGWPITWPPVSPTAEAEVRGWLTLQALRTLGAYGRLV